MNASGNEVSASRKRFARTVAHIAGTAAVVLLAACSTDRISGPAAPPPEQPANGLLGTALDLVRGLLTPVTGLLRLSPAPEIVRSITVDANGGVLEIPETGLRITIPRNAVSSRTTITVKSIAGSMVAYEFQPHGIKFAAPLTFSQDLSKTGWKSFSSSSLKGGYFKSTDQLLPKQGIALIDEELSARVVGGRALFDIWHFSGYLMSTGRATSPEASPE